MWKSYRSRARERCLLQPSLQPLQLPIPSSRSELILKLKTNQFLTRMGPYHNRPIYHSMKSPSQPWAQQVPTPPSPGLAPPCPMELESRNQPPSVLSTTTNHKMTTRCLSVLILLYPVQPPGGAARGGHRVCDGEVRRWVVCWDQPKNRWNCCLRRQNMSFFLCFRNLRNFPRQLCDTDIATSGNLILATYCTECSNLTLSLSPKTSPPNHHLVRLTSQLSLSPTTNTATAPSFCSPDF